MQNKTNMDVLKKLAVARRRNDRSGSIVSDDALDGSFCYHRQGDDCDTEMVDDLVGETIVVGGNDDAVVSAKKNFEDNMDSSSLSLYGRRRNLDSMAVVTANRFDSDEAFSEVARAMIHRYQHQNLSEKEAIHGTLKTADDVRAFIDALDLRFTVVDAKMDINDGNDGDDDHLSELVLKTRSIFDITLQAMCKELDSLSSSPMKSQRQEDSYKSKQQQQHREEMAPDLDDYTRTRHPKTPKNLRMSPMLTSGFNYNNHGFISQSESIDSACSEGSNGSVFRAFKRRRRWFFPQSNKNERQVVPVVSSSSSSSSADIRKPLPITSSLPKFHFDFGRNTNNKKRNFKKASLTFGDVWGSIPVKNDDGLASSYTPMGDRNGNATCMPPTSPIRKVSIEMKAND